MSSHPCERTQGRARSDPLLGELEQRSVLEVATERTQAAVRALLERLDQLKQVEREGPAELREVPIVAVLNDNLVAESRKTERKGDLQREPTGGHVSCRYFVAMRAQFRLYPSLSPQTFLEVLTSDILNLHI